MAPILWKIILNGLGICGIIGVVCIFFFSLAILNMILFMILDLIEERFDFVEPPEDENEGE